LNQSFAAVGAYTTGEVNLSAEDRPLRVRSASVDDRLLAALGLQPLAGRFFSPGETDLVPPPNPAGPVPLPPICILSYELWQNAFGGRQNMIGEMVEINGLRREVIGIMPPGADVMDNRTEIWMPIGLNPGNRLNRGSHFLYLVGRLKDGVTETQAKSELATLIRSWSERTGVKNHVFAPAPPADAPRTAANAGAGHILQMHAVQQQIVGSQPRDLAAASCSGIRVADCLREPRQPDARACGDAPSRVRRAHRARRRAVAPRAPVHDRRRAAVGPRRRAWPAAGASRRAGADPSLPDEPAAHR
jgi:hypothetical protein